jgi:hypothetical protein
MAGRWGWWQLDRSDPDWQRKQLKRERDAERYRRSREKQRALQQDHADAARVRCVVWASCGRMMVAQAHPANAVCTRRERRRGPTTSDDDISTPTGGSKAAGPPSSDGLSAVPMEVSQRCVGWLVVEERKRRLRGHRLTRAVGDEQYENGLAARLPPFAATSTLRTLLDHCVCLDTYGLFLLPAEVAPDAATAYRRAVPQPLCLRDMEARLAAGAYPNAHAIRCVCVVVVGTEQPHADRGAARVLLCGQAGPARDDGQLCAVQRGVVVLWPGGAAAAPGRRHRGGHVYGRDRAPAELGSE